MARLEDLAVPHSSADKLRGTTSERDKPHNPGFQYREIKIQSLWLKTPVGVAAVGETPRLTGELAGETHRVLERTQTHPPWNQHQKGPICLWVAGEVTKNWQRAEQAALFPLGLLPHSITTQQCGLPCPGEHLRLHPLLYNRHAKTKKKKKKGPNEITDHQSSRKNTTKQWRDSQPIRYTVRNTGYQDATGTHWVLQQYKKRPT